MVEESTVPKKSIRVRCWVVTEHNTRYFKTWKTTPKHDALRYMTYQLELCPTTNKVHIQAYIESYDRITRKRLKEILGSPSLHAEPRAAARKVARDYCHKDDSPWFRINYPQWNDHGGRVPTTDVIEIGNWDNRQGQRSDLDRVYDMIYSGSSELEILEQAPREYLKYHSGIRRARHLRTVHLCGKYHKVTTTVLHGGSRTGKTRHVMSKHGHENVYIPVWNGNKYWFTDYDGEAVLLLDEFYGQLRPHEIQVLLDNYHIRLEAKGTNPISQWSKIYITSNAHPESWWHSYKNIPKSVEQSIINRISDIVYFQARQGEIKTWDSISTNHEGSELASITYSLPVQKKIAMSEFTHSINAHGTTTAQTAWGEIFKAPG